MENIEKNSFLGNEKISKILLKFSIPCVISLLITALYNIVDQIFVGNSELGYLGNASTGIVFPLLIITQAFAWWIGDGCAAHLSICQGRNESEKSHKSIGTGMVVIFAMSIVLFVVALTLKEPILRLFGASDQTIDMSKTYLTILCFFFPLYMLQNMASPVIRSDGSPIYSMICLGSGAIVNIILDPIFIYGLKWGINGAAWATAIGQVVSFVITFAYFFRSKTFKLSLKSFIPNFKIFKEALILGISSFITQISIVIISLVCNIMLYKYGVLSKYGPDIPISIISVETKVFTVLINIIVGIVLGGQPIFGYNIGAKKFNRVKQTYLYILLATIIISLLFTLINEIFPDAFILPFGDGGDKRDLYMEYGRKTFRIFLSLVTFTCLIKFSSIFFQAVGKPFFAMICSLSRDIVCFIPAVIILPLIFEAKTEGTGIIALLYAAPIADTITIIISASLTIYYFKNISKLYPRDEDELGFENETNDIKESNSGLIITIAREHGSMGKQIGRLLAEKLGIPFYYKEVVALAAKESGLDSNYLNNISENQAINSNLYLTKNLIPEALNAQKEIIRKLAAKGSCVIVGRCANYILKDTPNLLSIYIYANEDYKIKNIMEAYNDDEASAIKNMKSSDLSRSNYYKFITGKDWKNFNNYKLCIDSSIGIDKTVELLYIIISELLGN